MIFLNPGVFASLSVDHAPLELGAARALVVAKMQLIAGMPLLASIIGHFSTAVMVCNGAMAHTSVILGSAMHSSIFLFAHAARWTPLGYYLCVFYLMNGSS
jgi:hypothetical protein